VEARTRELAEANRDLTEALEQQTATSEILRVISSSPTDVPESRMRNNDRVQNAIEICARAHYRRPSGSWRRQIALIRI
jgi:tryptophan 2,3-dioxygenase